jgi:hypothetical protein
MNMYDLQLTNRFRYSPADTYQALLTATSSLKGYDIDRTEDSVMSVYLNRKLSAVSMGEKIRVSVSPAYDGMSEVTINSTPKKRAQLFDPTATLKLHMEAIFIALSKELENYIPAGSRREEEQPDIYDQIKKLSDLKNSGIVTEEEFTAKKRQLLGLQAIV